ncbi:MAG TPA: DUF456 domain-containing protein [Gemmatirosa sp.]|nr:DUF456 domain-containing protein [Gemmatirosa sp.]
MTVVALGLVCALALVLVPLGLPGLWVIVLAALVHGPIAGLPGIGWGTVGVLLALALLAEGVEFVLGVRFAQRYGGGRRAAWGAVLGGFAGALVGVPVPIIGSVIGGFVGAFAGALVGEYSAGRDRQGATRAATGAVIGRAAAVGAKLGIGMAMAALAVGMATVG